MSIRTLKFWIATFVVAVFFLGCSQEQGAKYTLNDISAPEYMLQGGKDHFALRLPQIEQQPILSGGVLLAGDSITEGWLGYDIDLGAQVSNHGIGWDTVTGLKSRLPQMLCHSPNKIFILIGTNDIGYGRDVGEMAAELAVILDTFKREKPDTKLYVQSVMPREAENMAAVNRINTAYKALAEVKGVTFIDLAPSFAAADGTLKSDLTYDGLHLNLEGYRAWSEILKSHIAN